MIDRSGFTYDDDQHVYTLDGEVVPGVSTVAKTCSNPAPLIAWAYKIGRHGEPDETPWNVREKAANRGTIVHAAFEFLSQEGEVPNLEGLTAEEAGHVEAVLLWAIDYRPEPEAVEVFVFSREHRFAGRYDLRAVIDGETVLVDLKTSKGVYREHSIQLAGYELASREMGYPATSGQWVLQTRPDGTYDFVRSWAEPEDFLPHLAAHVSCASLDERDPRTIAARERADAKALALIERDARDAEVLDVVRDLGGLSARDVVERLGLDSTKTASAALGRLRKLGFVRLNGRTWIATVADQDGNVIEEEEVTA